MTTEQKYDLYISLLGEWNQKMNLVAPGTLADARTRHIADSAQLADFIPAVGPPPASRQPAAAPARGATRTPA
ncbi:MAG: class I SAM-dependent methyltransferase, partial [Rickettsiales bacterium]|nr:class I SAM-dependent methyltransferase [Rickettsiales bacterium]